MARNGNARSAQTDKKKEAFKTFKGDGYTIDFYVKTDTKKITCKITTSVFVIYGKVYFTDEKCGILYPSFKSGDKYVNQAFCFDSDSIKAHNAFIDSMLEELKW